MLDVTFLRQAITLPCQAITLLCQAIRLLDSEFSFRRKFLKAQEPPAVRTVDPQSSPLVSNRTPSRGLVQPFNSGISERPSSLSYHHCESAQTKSISAPGLDNDTSTTMY